MIKQKYPLIILIVVLITLLGLWLSTKYLMLTINVTPSLPYGLYIKNEQKIGNNDNNNNDSAKKKTNAILNENRLSELAPIDPSNFDFPQGAAKRATGMYKDIHEDRERRRQHSGKPKSYLRTGYAIKRGDLVLVCLNNVYKKYGLERGYLIKGNKCDGIDPLIKRVIALPGDSVILHRDYIMVNNTKYPYATASHDSRGILLNSYPRQKYPNTNGYWLIGTHHKNSWDSRYWGPVPRQQIVTTLKPLITHY